MSPSPGRSAADQVDGQVLRSLAALRLVTLLFAIGVDVARFDELRRPGLAVAVMALMVLWSAVVTWWLSRPHRRRPAVYVADLVVALVLLRTTPLMMTDQMMTDHASTITSYWVATAVLVVASRWGVLGGLAAASSVSVVDVTMRPVITASTVGNVFLLLLAAAVVGQVVTSLRTSAVRRAEAERRAAAAAERERLARVVHDGVLQVLALVQRRGTELGGQAAELAALAGEQESALRAFVQTGAGAPAVAEDGSARTDAVVDLMVGLGPLAGSDVTVSGPGAPVVLDREVADELCAAVRACLNNTRVHAPGASAWVLVDDAGDEITVSVRDDGPGCDRERLDLAVADGRLGVAQSIRGRIADLGGRADVVCAPGQGVEWDLSVPRPAGRPG